jgi:DNA repair protein RecN (Recombination protein N)
MLTALAIRDLLIIDRLDLAFQPGLNVLTGETGAGKSILLDALGLVLGWKGRADVVRQGAAQAEVEAVFDLAPGHPAWAVLEGAGLAAGDELILRRTVTVDGRRAAFVNDRRAGAEVLRDLGDTLVELHGQNDDRGLLNPRGHRALLDAFAGIDPAPARAAWRDRSEAARALQAAQDALAGAKAREDTLRHDVAELDRLSPQPGEEAALDAQRRLMQGAEKLRVDLARAEGLLGEEGAEAALLAASRLIAAAAGRAEGRLDPALAALDRALIELAEAQGTVASTLAALDLDPRALEAAEERLFAIRKLARKHDVAPDALAALADDLRAQLAALDGGVAGLSRLERALAAAETTHAEASAALTAARRDAAQRLDAAMAAELAPLKMERAVFRTVIAPAEPGPEGADAVTFTVATNPGAPAGPLNRIASGGELSRFLLALKVCLAGDMPGQTLIFDEIDRGVGGATADAVGRRLAALAGGAQVLVVTHSPQVAALGAHHWRVEKRIEGERTLSTVTPLTPADRIEEIARMLAGDRVTDAARDAARALLKPV